LLWKNAFIVGTCEFAIISSACMWYFDQDEGQKRHFVVIESCYRTFRHHLGSVSFGALVIAIVSFVKFYLEFIEA